MLDQSIQIQSTINRDGFALIPGLVDDAALTTLIAAIESLRDSTTSHTAPGMRHLLKNCPQVRTFAMTDTVRHLVTSVLGEGAHPVRAILFDKTPASNWYVTWHQDLTIAVDQKIDAPGYGPWSNKHGIVHVQPPIAVLERMVSLRIHLDDSTLENGAIKFIPGSHAAGLVDPDAIASWKAAHTSVCCPAKRGDVIAMRPLILHASSQADNPDHRRVLHIEYANAQFPDGLNWAEA